MHKSYQGEKSRRLPAAAGLLRRARSAPVPVGLQVIQALGVKHLQVGTFDHLFQPVAGPAGGDPGRDAQLEVGIVLVVELDQFRKRGQNECVYRTILSEDPCGPTK